MANEQELTVAEVKQQLAVIDERKQILRRDFQAVKGDLGLIGRLTISSVLTTEQTKFIRQMSEIRLEEIKLVAKLQQLNFRDMANYGIHGSRTAMDERAAKVSEEAKDRLTKRLADRTEDMIVFVMEKIESIKENPLYDKYPQMKDKAISELETRLEETIEEMNKSYEKFKDRFRKNDDIDFI